MLEKDGTTFIAQCDFCSETHDTDENDFHAGIDAIKREGWKVFKQSGEWFHKCGCCQAESAGKDFEDVA
jgi:hypothetical protein